MKIFDAKENDFTGWGLGPLPDALEAEIPDELNGAFTLAFAYPEQGFNADKLVPGNIVFTKSRPSDTVGEPFRISEIRNSIDGTITVLAQHASYDMNYIVFTGQINTTVTGIVNACSALNTYRTSNGFIRIDNDGIDVNDPAEFDIGSIQMLSEAFASGQGSLLKTFNGEVRYGYRTDIKKEIVYICARRGVDRNIDVAYGFNMLDFLRILTNTSQISHIKAYLERDNNGTKERAVEDFTLDASLPERWLLVDVTGMVDWGATRAEIEAAVAQKIGGADLTKMLETITTEVVPGAARGIDETQINVGDSLRVQYPQLNISVQIRIVKAVYDVIADRYKSIELGTLQRTVADTIADLEENQAAPYDGSVV